MALAENPSFSTHIKQDWDNEQKSLNISVLGDFVGDIEHDFRASYQSIGEIPKNVVINLKDTHYMDSTALGLLLELRAFATNHNCSIHLINMNDVVLEIFRVLNFHKIFKPGYTREYYEDNTKWASNYFYERAKAKRKKSQK